MPVIYEPQLNHIGFDWDRDYKVLHRGLLDRETRILTKLGFYREYGALDDPTFTGHIASIELLDELSGILGKGATIIMDAGWKAPHQIDATLDTVEKDPNVLRTRSVEPEALGSLAASYQRTDEPRGTFWFDITDGHLTGVCSLDQIREAARFARARLRREAARGRRKKSVTLSLLLNWVSFFYASTRKSLGIRCELSEKERIFKPMGGRLLNSFGRCSLP
jgi:hypothetical protein